MLCAPVWFHHSCAVSLFVVLFYLFFFLCYCCCGRFFPANVAAAAAAAAVLFLFAAVQFAVMKHDGISCVCWVCMLILCHGWSRFIRDTHLLEWSRKHVSYRYIYITISKFVCVYSSRSSNNNNKNICACVLRSQCVRVWAHKRWMCEYRWWWDRGACVYSFFGKSDQTHIHAHALFLCFAHTHTWMRTYRFSELLPNFLHSFWNSVFKLPFVRSSRISVIGAAVVSLCVKA